MTRKPPRQVDTVVIGSGPSALILSYILHGNIPEYDRESPHPDPLLHQKLAGVTDLLSTNVGRLTEHFNATRFSYSKQALLVNVLFDTLNRPFGETDDSTNKTCIKWRHDPPRAVPHAVLGSASTAGGQWVENHMSASWDTESLSYAGMLSLPGYSFAEYYESTYGQTPSFFLRPSRRHVAKYFSAYPAKVNINDAIYYDQQVHNIQRTENGFYIASHGIRCNHLVLASGIFTKPILARPLLEPLLRLPASPCSSYPLLVVGSGFGAADVMISAPPQQKLLHIFKWAPRTNPSPLRACHHDAYPEYAGIYKKMKSAATRRQSDPVSRSVLSRSAPSSFNLSRDWSKSYEGFSNTLITNVEVFVDHALVTLQTDAGETFQRKVSGLAYAVGKHGSLAFLAEDLRREVCPDILQSDKLTKQTLRGAATKDLEIAKDVFVIGSLTGDLLIRFAHGACGYAAGKIMLKRQAAQEHQYRYGQTSICDLSKPEEIAPNLSDLDAHHLSYSSRHGINLHRPRVEIAVE